MAWNSVEVALSHEGIQPHRLGFVIGIVVCSVMMNVVRGAVNTLIVCWADSPARLEENHPDSTREMAETWSKVFPEARVYIVTSTTQAAEPVSI